jgi:hypothetical protein
MIERGGRAPLLGIIFLEITILVLERITQEVRVRRVRISTQIGMAQASMPLRHLLEDREGVMMATEEVGLQTLGATHRFAGD